MKNTLLISTILLITLSAIAQNQDWRPVRTDDVFFYSGNEEYRAYKIDSIVEYSDSVIMFSYPEIFALDYDDCFNPYGPSWIGKRFVLTNNKTVIYNYFDNPITLLQSTQIGTKWHLYDYSETNFIEAEIISKTYENIGFTEDSTITISITSNNNLNGAQIKISKSYGIIQGFNFLLFPEVDTELQKIGEYKLTGVASKKESKANLTSRDIYNFEIGDEFHTHKYYVTWPEGDVHINEKVIKKVTSKTFNSDSSEVTYTFDLCDKNGKSNIQQTYSLNSELLNQLPFEPIWGDYPLNSIEENGFVFCQIGDYSNGYRFKDFGGHYGYMRDSCYEFIVIDKKKKSSFSLPYVMQDGFYIEGLGGLYYNYVFMLSEDYYRLVYYKKGDTEWGTPYDCDKLIGIDENIKTLFQIFPNPSKNNITIEGNIFGQQTTLYIFDILGQQLQQSKILTEKELISIADLPKGMLFYQIKTEGKTIKSGIIIKE